MYGLAALSRNHIFAACSFSEDEYEYSTELLEFSDGTWSRSSYEGSPRCLARTDEGSGPLVAVLIEPYRAIVTPALARRETIAEVPRNAQGRMMGGHLSAIRQIGSHLYVCGYGGQFYCRDTEGQWRMVNETLLVPFRPYDGAKTFLELDGPNENEIYIAHDEGCSFWDGRSLQKIEGSGRKITDIFVESPSSIWLCGWHGLVMHGNYVDGFRVIVQDPRDQMFVSLCRYDDAIYLGSVDAFDVLKSGRIESVGSLPRLDHHYRISAGVEVIDDVMWAVGEGDLLRYDGVSWTEVPFDPPWASLPPLGPP